MTIAFILAGTLSVIATLFAITRLNAVHALLYLIGALLALAVTFYTLGATFASALEVMVYAGAIVVLLLFVVMILNLGGHTAAGERTLLSPRIWIGPAILVVLVAVVLGFLLAGGIPAGTRSSYVGPHAVSMRVFGPYLLAVEAVSFLLLAGVIGAFHLGRKHFETRANGELAGSSAAERQKEGVS